MHHSINNGPVDRLAGLPRHLRIFEDTFENWEQNAVDGNGPGPRISLGDVKRDKPARFRLQEKYKGLFFVDKDPDGDNGYYADPPGDPLPSSDWEHRKVVGLAWQNHKGWRVETKLCNDSQGPSANYFINTTLIRMIKESNRNRSIRFRSAM